MRSRFVASAGLAIASVCAPRPGSLVARAFVAAPPAPQRGQRGAAGRVLAATADASAPPPVDATACSILFDFDGTLGDTETPAMQVAYWEICPYLPNLTAEDLDENVTDYVRENAGKAFEFMIDACDAQRKKVGFKTTVEQAWKAGEESPDKLKVVDSRRSSFGLPPLREASAKYSSLLEQQKIETVDALSKVAEPTPCMLETLQELRKLEFPMAIATTSPKPRVPVSVVTAGLAEYFPDHKIHSGESDFDPPRFKPAPDVYLRAASYQGALPNNCIAVEDSASGVGSASNAGLGLIVGYVGASHFAEEMRDAQAKVLMSGDRSDNGRGAEVVISDMRDLVPIAEHYRKTKRSDIPLGITAGLQGRVWVKSVASSTA